MATTFTPIALALLVACNPRVGDTPCDPLAGEITEEQLVDVRGVGEASDGVLYVIDDRDFEARVYVSEDGVLERHRVVGSGESSQGDTTTLLLSVSDEPENFVLAHEDSASVERMALAFGVEEERDFEAVVAAGELLVVLDEAAIDGMPAQFATEVALEYHARIEADEEVVVVRPRDDWDYEDFLLFLGPPDAMAERRVYEVLRASDGGSTWIEFDYHGSRATLVFPYSNLEPADARLETNTGNRDVEWLDTEGFDADDFGFLCR